MESESELLLEKRLPSESVSTFERVYVGASALLNLGSTGLGAVAIARGIEIGNIPLSALGICVAWWNGQTMLSMSRYFEEQYPRRDED
jgi:hypothetical protein